MSLRSGRLAVDFQRVAALGALDRFSGELIVAGEALAALEGDFDRRLFDEDFVRERSTLITRGWKRLQELAEQAQTVPISEYPLPEFRTQRS